MPTVVHAAWLGHSGRSVLPTNLQSLQVQSEIPKLPYSCLALALEPIQKHISGQDIDLGTARPGSASAKRTGLEGDLLPFGRLLSLRLVIRLLDILSALFFRSDVRLALSLRSSLALEHTVL